MTKHITPHMTARAHCASEDAVIAVTERAKELLLEHKRVENIEEPGVGLRVEAGPAGQWMLVIDRPRKGDRVVEHNGVAALLVSPDVQTVLAGTKVDCLETPDGTVELALTRI